MNFNCVRIVLKFSESLINRRFLSDCKSVGDAFGGSNPPSSTKSLESLTNRAFQGFLLCQKQPVFSTVFEHSFDEKVPKSATKC